MQLSPSAEDYPIEHVPLLDHGKPYIASPEKIVLPKGDITRLHMHESLELGRCLSGSGLFLTEERLQLLQPGDAILVFPGQVHYSCSLDGEECRCEFIYCDMHHALGLAGISLAALDRFQVMSPMLSGVIPAAEAEINRLVKQMMAEVYAGPDISLAGAYLYTLLLLLLRSSDQACSTVKEPLNDKAVLWQVMPALRAICLWYAKPLTLPFLASTCCLSVSHFGRLFTACTGKTPYRYLSDYRMEIAANLLMNTNDTITEIAMRIGYSNQSDFYRHFFRAQGCAPSSYRKMKRQIK